MGYKRTTEPTSEPITTAEAKTHCRVDHTADDTYIDTLIATARRWCEDYRNTTAFTTTWTLKLDCFPSRDSYYGSLDTGRIDLPRPPVASVTSVAYIDDNGDSQTVSASDYTLDNSGTLRASIYPAYGVTWPSTRAQRGAVTVVYVAGAATTGAIPATFKQAVKLLVGHWYENREGVLTGTISKEIEFSVKALLDMEDASVVG